MGSWARKRRAGNEVVVQGCKAGIGCREVGYEEGGGDEAFGVAVVEERLCG